MSWEIVKIEEIFDVARGGSPRPINDFLTDEQDGVNWIMIGDTKDGGKYIKQTAKKIKPEGVMKSRIVNEGDFLLTNSMSFGRPYILKTSGCIHDGWLVLSPINENIHTDYFYYYLGSEEIKIKLALKASGAVVKNLNKDIVKKLKIPLPPLDQQKQIAHVLDTADAYRQKTKALIEKYDELTQSLFLDMFGDPVTNPKGWSTKTIVDIASSDKYAIKRGPFGGALKKEIFVEDGYLVYEQYHALNNDFTFARYFIDESKFQELKGFEVKPDDIIISCSGVYLGKLAIVPKEARPGIINQALLKVTVNQNVMTNRFFTFHFRQKNFRDTFFGANRGAGIPNFPPMKDFKKFPFIVPPLNLQKQFEERIQAIEAQKALAQQELDKANYLFNSLLRKAFKGELVS
ncbi:restriction endonuclease subunit S [Meridianimaribacter sp. CL38]|uniref:restriction endonuclease subunit S n=1 Tax=Meridianimaribacter sp. CL38 TaxID=2213021 RepID=UPI001040D729|nr:restriction endonuclease subunit S [Meridianimaribacter sp. CL38]TBV26548.1 restriction endonuclease subunit S [Meridianimaribacter sp. CL38]